MSKIIDSIIGGSIGDAMGIATKLCSREELLSQPIIEMKSSSKNGQQPGSWSNNILMEILVIESLADKCKLKYDDISNIISELVNNRKEFSKFISNDNNVLLVIMLPVALYSYYKNLNNEQMINLINKISVILHASDTSRLVCYMYVRFVNNLLQGISKEEAYKLLQEDNYSLYSNETITLYNRLIKNNIQELNIDDIKSSENIIDTLECCLWIILNTISYKECIVVSTNIGGDTNTIGTIVGAIAGIIYGIDTFPKKWLNVLTKKEYLIDVANKFSNILCNNKKDVLLGTIIGDVAGSRFELNNNRNKNFELLHPKYSRFTDDTVMTLAVAKIFLKSNDSRKIKEIAVDTMVEVGRKYPQCGYGRTFFDWINKDNHEPYGSYGNGAAMRVSSIPLVTNDINEIKEISKLITEVSHNHDDAITGAEAVCMCIHLALNNNSKTQIKKYIEENYYILDDTVKNLSNNYKFNIKCSETVKPALIAFFESIDFEDAIRNAISIGGDSDTIGAITGGIAAAYYGIPGELRNKVLNYLDDYLKNILNEFNLKYNGFINNDI